MYDEHVEAVIRTSAALTSPRCPREAGLKLLHVHQPSKDLHPDMCTWLYKCTQLLQTQAFLEARQSLDILQPVLFACSCNQLVDIAMIHSAHVYWKQMSVITCCSCQLQLVCTQREAPYLTPKRKYRQS